MSSNKTLVEIKQYLADKERSISANIQFQDIKYVKDVLADLSALTVEIESVLDQATKVKASIHSKLLSRISIFRRELQTIDNSSPRITSQEATTIIEPYILPEETKGPEIVSGISIPGIIEVNTLDGVPDSNLYWVKDINQFAVKICGFVIRGNIGDIYPLHSTSRQMLKIISCKYGNACKNINLPNGCNYYHDPIHINKKDSSKQIRNYTNGSWTYTHEPFSEHNKSMRHIGNRSSFTEDLHNVSADEANRWVDQSMHTLLTTLALYAKGKII